MNNRIERICAQIPVCGTLADVGCDHGYIARFALDNNLCARALLTDISAQSLKKAQTLLRGYIQEGRAAAYLTDGLTGVCENYDTAVIAGMGGTEIISIIERAPKLPERLILQPMKNAYELRQRLIKDYKILRDEIFYSREKHYILITAQRGADSLNPAELMFGKTGVNGGGADFMRYMLKERQEVLSYLKKTKDQTSAARLSERLNLINQTIGPI